MADARPRSAKSSKKKKGKAAKKAEEQVDVGSLQAKIAELSNKENEEARLEVKDARKAGAAELGKLLRAREGNEDIIDAALAEYNKIADQAQNLEQEKAMALARVKDRDAIFSELARTRTVKEKLEELCRQLQKQSRDVAAHEQLKRDELNSKFQTSIDDISTKLQEQSQMEAEKALLSKRLELLTKQAELREQQAVAEENAKNAHIELLETKLLQATTQAQIYDGEVKRATQSEAEMKQQLDVYTEKFASFQDTLTGSNEMFANFKKEMEKLHKKIRKLEKEKRAVLEDKSARESQIVQLSLDKQESGAKLVALEKKNGKLESLCRTLQQQLKAARSATPAVSDATVAASNAAEKQAQPAAAATDTPAALDGGGALPSPMAG